MNLLIGSTVGDYEIMGILGAGGMGAVYKVRNTISDRVEALKVLLPDLASQPELAERFLREIKLHATLDHPNIAALRTALRYENQLLMVMELVEGVTLAERRQQGPVPLPDVLDYIGQVLIALSYAHERGVVHRDIKPANMMLTPGGTIKLMDFGIAKGAADRKLTMTGATVGSLYYMSPEQIRGTAAIDHRSDLYSLGVCLYELVTNQRPFDGETQFDIMTAHLEKAPVPPISIDPSLPAGYESWFGVPALPKLNWQSADLRARMAAVVRRWLEAPFDLDGWRIDVANMTGRYRDADVNRKALAGVLHAPAAAQAAVTPVAAPPAHTRRPRRGLWVAAGGLCTALALIAVIQFGPWKKTAASGNPLVTPPVVSEPVQASPANGNPAPPPPVESAPAPASTTPALRQIDKLEHVPEAKPAAQAVSTQVAPARVATPEPVRAAPENRQRSSAPPVEAPTAVPPSQGRDLQQARESLARLGARAASIRSTLQSLQQSQAAGGLGLRGDWLESAHLMDAFLQGASDALAAADAPAARDLTNKAERQVEKLEKALNK